MIKTNEVLRTRISDDDLIRWNRGIIKEAIRIGYREGEAMGYANIANRFIFKGDLKKGLEYLNKAEDISKKYKNNFLFGKINQEYSQIYNKMNVSKMALDYSSKALNYGLKLKKDNRDCRLFLRYIYSTRSVYMYAVNQPDSAIIYLHKSLKIDANPLDVANIGIHYTFSEVRPDSAKYYFQKAFVLLETKDFKHNRYQRAVVYHNYGLFLRSQGENNQAINAFKMSTEFAKRVNRPMLILGNYKELCTLYKKVGNVDKENEYLNKAVSLKDSMDANQNQAINLSINRLNNDRENEKAQLENQSNATLWYGVISMLLVILIIIYFYLRIRKKKKKLTESEKIILEKEKETKDLKRKLNENYENIIQLAREKKIDFFPKFQEAYPELCKELLKINPNLSKSDLSFCAMIWLGFSSKEIAQCTSMEHRSVQTKKYRIRKKLNLESETDLYHFFRSISEP
ncbi:LuxR C-terminal-related transcriptional regulator [Chryseobacterium sp. CBSDS_008]|uniref:helix-turn-helix transcriptional regulator n=1 Tax=Chryseobacterium sp. CBSDS_008 TaxID=3415265 RepID=UPI003CEE9832